MGAFPGRRRRGSLRRVLTAAGAAVLAIAMAACGGGGGIDVPPGGTPVNGGTATYALPPSTVPNYIFPFDSSTYFSVVNSAYFQHLLYRPLYWFGNGTSPTLNANLSLADPPQYKGNQVTIRMKGWKWSNGETVTAQDVVFWIHMMQAVGAFDWGAYMPGGFPANVRDVKTVSPTELTITMAETYNSAWFTDNELSQITPMPQAWDMTGPGRNGHCTTMVSDCAKVYSYLDGQSKARSTWADSKIWSIVDGPWKLASFNADGNSTFVPNKSYSGSPKPRLAKFVEVPFTTENAEYSVLRATGGSQTLDVGYLPMTDTPAKPVNQTVGRNPVPNYYLDPLYSWSINYFPVNFQSTTGNGPVIRQLYFRQALEYLMNQEAVIQGPLRGYGQYTTGPVGTYPATSYLSSQGEKGDPFPYNLATAKQLLSSHGWNVVPNDVTTCTDPAKCGPGVKKGARLVFTVPYAASVDWMTSEMIQLQSNATLAGIKINLVPRSFNQVTALAAGNCVVAHISCDWDMANWGAGWTFLPDYYPSGETLFLSGSRANPGGYTDATDDKLIRESLTTASSAPLYQWQDYLANQVPVIWQPNAVYELTEVTNKLRGVVPQSTTLNLNPEYWYFVK
jgi:peptide/nickel transport system substrate-binding protein